jgi:pyruvate dehydrogenase E1 component alpha subunit
MADDSSASPSSSGLNGSFDEVSGFPDDFPHASRLKKAGVDSLSDLRDIDALEDLSGIGPTYAEEIAEALERLDVNAAGDAATTEKRPSPLSGDGAAEEAPEGPWTQQSIDIPEGPIEETLSFDTYPADTYTHDDLGMADEEVVELLRSMLLQRRFENRCRQMYQRQKISGFLHLYIGQEAVSTGSVSAINLGDDSIITAYRDHGMGLAMGMTPEECMAELFGKATGCSKGKGGSMHFFDAEKKMMGGHAIVGAHLPLGAGIAFAHKYRGEDNVCLCFFGDGAMHQGAFREACNLAGIYELPIVFICENNQYAMGTAVDRAFSKPDLYKHGYNFDFPCSLASGMDVFSVNQAVSDHVENYARQGQPSMLEVRTYRYQGHSITDPAEYRAENELDQRKSEDAIVRLQQYIVERGIATDDDIDAIDEEAKQAVVDAIDAADAAPFPDEQAIYDDVYTQEDYPFLA